MSVRSTEVPVEHPEAELTLTDESAPAFAPNAFERVTRNRTRPGYRVEPVAIAWNAVVFALKGDREAIACIPRSALGTFVDDLDSGRLDDTIREFLASPPAGRVLRNSDQTTDARLFDSLESPGAVVPPERSPGRLGRFGGAGTPTGSRPNKRARRPRRFVVAAAIVVVALVGGGVAIAARGGKSTTVAATTPGAITGQSTGPTTPPSTAPSGGPDLKVDLTGGFVHIAGTFCGSAGQGHFDISGQISQGGLSITVDGGVDLTLSPDGTGSYSGHMDIHPPVGAPLVNQLSGNAKVNRFDGNEAEIEVVDGAFNGNAGPGPSPLPFSRANPAHHALPATSGAFC